MPLQRRLPKVGFSSRAKKVTAEIRLHEIVGLQEDMIDLAALRKAGVINNSIKRAKIVLSGTSMIDRPIKINGLKVTKGVRSAIEAAGGSITSNNG